MAQVLKPLQDETLKNRLSAVLRSGLQDQKLLEFMKQSYEVNRNLETKMMLRAMSRSTQVIGKMFEDIADRNQMEGKRLAWIARLGQIFWGVIEVAVPGSMMNLFFFHWLKIVYAFEAFLILASILINANPDVTKFGWILLALTLVLNVVVLLLGDYIRGKNVLLKISTVLLVVALLFLATIGLGQLVQWSWTATLLGFLHGVMMKLRILTPASST